MRVALIACALSVAALAPAAEGAKVLAFFGLSTKSHNNFFTPLTTELALRGHEVTVVSAYPLKNPPAKNYRQIEATVARELLDSLNAIKESSVSTWSRIMTWRDIAQFMLLCNDVLKMPQVEDLKKEKFDLVLVNLMLNDCAYPFARLNGAPLVLLGPGAGALHWDFGVGNPEPTSYVPNLALPFTDHMTFFERLMNTLLAVTANFIRCTFYLPVIDAATKEFFGPDTPPASELLKNTSLIILNSHFSLNYPRPFVPAVIEAGGMHVKKNADPLTKDFQEFLDGAENGAILFSMGSILQAKDMEEDVVKAFTEAFAELPQRVIWKWESDTLPGRPKNVKTSPWLPQQAILAHPNVKLFITHGGMLSTHEASYNGVPLIGIPMMSDQRLNVLQSENMGYCVGLPYETVTKESVLAAVKKVLSEPSYKKRAEELQSRVKDQPQTPLERAVFWTEYVLRHNGAAHMRSAAVDLNWMQLNLVDVYLTIAAFFALPIILAWCIVRKLLSAKNKSQVSKKLKKKKKN